ncbi:MULTISPECIES: type II toxin-antitoxin system VapB family antitoxin [unclassified Thalassospira]|uniref:type II toxin-antitoxin system VapB family antitoxin n=1 Tax=unclassified Thalassospira TaxID=2648997 RepID=UPI0007AD767D|nr:type II toxin-antitoxin system VapB family antitoxin [Thalassospira sp. MCCC 1A02491]KZB65095.1 antitoxin [Thalassospira sp. MCCC 1A02491]RCK27355.1 hypothetical protein TH8_05450 [Thalassospira profundimaris]
MKQTTVFSDSKGQAVRIPAEMAFPQGTKTVAVHSINAARVVTPVDHLWDTFFDSPSVSLDFMEDRNQPKV